MAKYLITPDGGVKRCPCNCQKMNRTNQDYLNLAADVAGLVMDQIDEDTPVREALQQIADKIKRTVENG